MSQTQESRIRFAQMTGVETPILNAPMSGIATPAMVAAVSEAGGLGVIPATDLMPEQIIDFARQVKALTQRPFAINLTVPDDKRLMSQDNFLDFCDAISMLLTELELPDGTEGEWLKHYDMEGKRRPDFFKQFEAALSVKPVAMISSFGGFREPEADRLEEEGILNIGTATTLREAKVLRAAGCQAIIVQGAEAAGPRLSFEDPEDAMVGLMALVPAAVKATGLPVLAAGGIATADQMQGLFAMGAAGAMIGTALLTTKESGATEVHRYYAESGTACDTVMTRIYNGRLSRVLRNGLVDALADYENKTAGFPAQWALMGPLHEQAVRLGRFDLTMLPLGQSAGRSAYRTVEACLKALSVHE